MRERFKEQPDGFFVKPDDLAEMAVMPTHSGSQRGRSNSRRAAMGRVREPRPDRTNSWPAAVVSAAVAKTDALQCGAAQRPVGRLIEEAVQSAHGA